ncbi:KEOPS complex subunit Cgi121 [Hyperthermus butylicus]|uniref:KEOPS complex subunit Cgi121 n=1 Tax=Hyperthermus butylicus TaxID=54248 RepID=UPI00064EE974|nr:KEOPS complex subunit Cgi121 [Hyperthermus butylicus]
MRQGIRLQQLVPGLGRISLLLLCTRTDEELEKLADSLEADRKCIVGIIPVSLASRHSLKEVLAATIAVYAAYARGKNIARKPGIDVLLYLAGERNISKVLQNYPLRYGEPTVLAVACKNPESLDLLARKAKPATSCSLRRETEPLMLAKIAVFPVEAKVYKLQA